MRISDWSSDVCSSDLLVSWGVRRVAWRCRRCEKVRLHHQRICCSAAEQVAQRKRGFINVQFVVNRHSRVPGPLPGDRMGSACSKHRRFLGPGAVSQRSEEHTSELQSLMRISYAVFCLKKTSKLYIKQSKFK